MSLNRVTLLGNVGKDPEVRYLDNGVAVAQFSLATTERGYAKEDGTQVPDRTEWHDIVAWRGLAQTIEKYVKKGDKLYVEGKLRHRSYDDKEGVRRRTTEVFIDNMEMLTPKGDGKPLPQEYPSAPQQTAYGMETKAANAQASACPTQSTLNLTPTEEDDIPF